jgi:hypothetical protein
MSVTDGEGRTVSAVLEQRMPQLKASDTTVARLIELLKRAASFRRVQHSTAESDLVAALSRGDVVAVRLWAGDVSRLSPGGRTAVLTAVLETLPAHPPAPLRATFAIPSPAELWSGMAPVLVVTALRLLHARGLDLVSPWRDGYTPLTFAAFSPAVPLSVLRLLLEVVRVPANSVDGAGRCALHCAVLGCQADKLRLLLQTRDVDVDHRDSSGATAYDVARERGLTLFADWLRNDKVCGGVQL